MYVAQMVGAIIALSAVGVVTWSTWVSVAGSSAYSQSVRNSTALEEAAAAISASAISYGGVVTLPAPTADGGVPDWVSAQTVTPWGKDFRYCPYATGSGGAASTANGYQIGTLSLAGRDYVVSSDAPTVSGTAFAIIAGMPGEDAPACSDVSYAGGEWSVPDGRVRGYALSAIRGFRTASGVMHVSSAGTGTGLSSADPASLSDAIGWWEASRPQSMEFVLAAGSYALPASVSGDVGGDVVFDAASGVSLTGDLSMPSDIRLSGVSVSGTVTVRQGTDAFVSGGSFGAINVYGEASIGGSATLSSLAAAAGGRVSVSAASVGSLTATTGGTATFASASATASASASDSGGTITASGGAAIGTETVGVGGRICTESGGTWSCISG
ncbi:MAG: hypothetical protein VR70_10940 [Rhodospirillaceae bacterium BRH_c57]|nr:MAG: hypothetical protein VR70_10940 [Rhodospirillaceae bacterium BRH_c57]